MTVAARRGELAIQETMLAQTQSLLKHIERSRRTLYHGLLIVACREMVQHRFSKANGYAADCTVIYGDTDSVMVDFHEPDCAKAMELGRAAAAEVSATFTKPIKLEFEKVSLSRRSAA